MGSDEIFIPTNLIDYTVEVYDTFAAFPEQGESGRFYVDASDNHTYAWSNDLYVVVPNSLLRYADSMPRHHTHTHLSLPNMADTEFAPLNSDTPTIASTNMLLQDTDGDIRNIGTIGTITYAAEGFATNSLNDVIQTINDTAQAIRIGNLDTSDPETFYDFLKMWPLYNNNGQVIGLFDTKEHRDQAKERLEKLTMQGPKETVLQKVFKNISRKTPADSIS